MNGEDWNISQNSRLQQQFEFLNEINALKSVYRASRIGIDERHENSAEHSWHLAMYALVLAEHADHPVNVSNVIVMLLLHDIVEVDAGDLPLHGSADPDREKKEQDAADRLYNLLPADQAIRYRVLWMSSRPVKVMMQVRQSTG